jgi:Carboxylesterase family
MSVRFDRLTSGTDGELRGQVTSAGRVPVGIPFASPRADDLRWRSPPPPASWRGLHEATTAGPGERGLDGTTAPGPATRRNRTGAQP